MITRNWTETERLFYKDSEELSTFLHLTKGPCHAMFSKEVTFIKYASQQLRVTIPIFQMGRYEAQMDEVQRRE